VGAWLTGCRSRLWHWSMGGVSGIVSLGLVGQGTCNAVGVGITGRINCQIVG